MSAAERKRLERERLAEANIVRFEVRLPQQVFAQLEQLQGADKAISRDQVIQAAIALAFAQCAPTAAAHSPASDLTRVLGRWHPSSRK